MSWEACCAIRFFIALAAVCVHSSLGRVRWGGAGWEGCFHWGTWAEHRELCPGPVQSPASTSTPKPSSPATASHLAGLAKADGARLQTIQLPDGAVSVGVGHEVEGLALGVGLGVLREERMRGGEAVVHLPDRLAVPDGLAWAPGGEAGSRSEGSCRHGVRHDNMGPGGQQGAPAETHP